MEKVSDENTDKMRGVYNGHFEFSVMFIVRSIHNFSELVTINAMPKKEIIGLKIKHGTLIGSEQQDAIYSQNKDSHSIEGSKHWYFLGKGIVNFRYRSNRPRSQRDYLFSISTFIYQIWYCVLVYNDIA